MAIKLNTRTKLLLCSTLVSVGFMPMQALAQDGQLADIVVTAQKREQNVQDVPIAVTALGQAALAANRVVSVADLSGLAPGVQIVTAAGGSQIPAFSVRGVTSYGVVPGSDKEVSIYLDGVYISSPRGGIFNLPDMAGIEMLRGPQGTLFGRNATAGAVSMSTRDPNGKVGATAVFTVGNYDQFGAKLTVNTPQIGAFSATGTYSHQYKRGDVKNLAAGATWDRTASNSQVGKIASSPAYLGTKNADAFFVAVKFQPADNFKMVYKHDYDLENNSPDATSLVAFDAGYPATLPVGAAQTIFAGHAARFATLKALHPEMFNAAGKRPEAVSNGYTLTSPEKVFGHSVTTTWDAGDNLTIKNITAWRKTFVSVATAYDGFAGYVFTAADAAALATTVGPVAAGQAFGTAGLQPESTSRQFSSELQINYRSQLATITAGALWFHGSDYSGSAEGLPNTYTFNGIGLATANGAGNFVLGRGRIGQSRNDAKSAAVYVQAEIHATPKLDVILGGRLTKDSKSGTFTYGTNATSTTVGVIPFTFVKTKPNWLVGLNYKPNDDVLLYAKASTAFVSGGSASGVPFQPETATSFEVGAKAEWFDRRLRTNLSVYTVTYENLQTAQGAKCCVAVVDAAGLALSTPVVGLSGLISTFIAPIGGPSNAAPVTARGFEFEAVGALGNGFTTGGSLGYSKVRYTYVDPNLIVSNGGQYIGKTLKPEWTGAIWGQFESKPFANGSRIVARIDANWHSKILMTPAPDVQPLVYQPYNYVGANWLVNGRVALTNVNIGGVDAEIALWGKNLTQNRDMTFMNNLKYSLSANFQAARTLGVDIKLHY